jgi:hypothetical protein
VEKTAPGNFVGQYGRNYLASACDAMRKMWGPMI